MTTAAPAPSTPAQSLDRHAPASLSQDGLQAAGAGGAAPLIGPYLGEEASSAPAVVCSLLRDATGACADEGGRHPLVDEVAWATESPDGTVREWLVRALYWVAWEMAWLGDEPLDEDVVEAAAAWTTYPGVTVEHLEAVMADARASEDAPPWFPRSHLEVAAVATLAAVWMRDLTHGDQYDQLIDQCVAETAPY